MKKVIFMLAAAAVMASCTKTEIYETLSNGTDIIAQSTHQPVSSEVTRAPFIGNIASDNQLAARVVTFGSSAITCDGIFNFTSWGTVTSYDFTTFTAGTGKYPAAASMDLNYYMVGLYPETGWGAVTAKTSVVTQSVTGSKDIMVAGMQTIAKQDILDKIAPQLTFKHQLTKFEVKVKAKDAAADAIWTTLSSLKVTAINGYATLPGSISYALDGSATTFIGSATDYGFFGIDNTGTAPAYNDTPFAGTAIVEAPAAGNTAVAYSMVPPFVPTNNEDVTISIMADAKPFDVKVNIPVLTGGATDTAGYTYTVSLTFADAEAIIAEATVTAWTYGGETDHTIN